MLEITREVIFLSGKNQGKHTKEIVLYVSSMEMKSEFAKEMLAIIRKYWDIEGALHQRLDVTAKEDASRVRNRNAIWVLGIFRRSLMTHFTTWRANRQNKRQSTLLDFYDMMSAFNQKKAWAIINPRSR